MHRRFFIPEYVQPSGMDCGPAALYSLIKGYGFDLDYPAVRGACNTNIEGTAIDDLERYAQALGFDAEQRLLPPEQLSFERPPYILVTRLPLGLTHVMVVWRRVGQYVQVLDPAVGRRWMHVDALMRLSYRHRMDVPIEAVLEWIKTDEYRRVRRELFREAFEGHIPNRLLQLSERADDWQQVAYLEASARFAIHKNRPLQDEWSISRDEIPEDLITLRPSTSPEMVSARGALILKATPTDEASIAIPPRREQPAAAKQPFTPTLLVAWSAVAGLSLVLVAEPFLARLLLESPPEFAVPGIRVLAFLLIIGTALLGILTEVTSGAILLHIGASTEKDFRRHFGKLLRRLPSDFFSTRLSGDLAERVHATEELRHFESVRARLIGLMILALMTILAIYLLDAMSLAEVILSACIVGIGISIARRILAERDLTVKELRGALARVYVDAQLGSTSLQAHSAEQAVTVDHERLLTLWFSGSKRLHRTIAVIDTVAVTLALGLAIIITRRSIAANIAPEQILLLAYLALNLPVLTNDLIATLQSMTHQRSTRVRLSEPGMYATSEPPPREEAVGPPTLEIKNLSYRRGSNEILTDVSLIINPGQKVAIVGLSGAGKSTLLKIIMSVITPTTGSVRLGGVEAASVSRSAIVWVSPDTWLWDCSVDENVRFGNEGDKLAEALSAAGLGDDFRHQAKDVGVNGRSVSGGQAQRIRIARGAMKTAPTLVLFDEALRHIEPELASKVLQNLRSQWRDATWLFVTHDIARVQEFDRVLVIDHGRIIQDGAPAHLLAQPGPLRTLREHEERVQKWTRQNMTQSWTLTENGNVRT